MEDKVKFDVCPKCGSDDTGHMDDWVYDYGWSSRICDGENGCGTKYMVNWETIAVSKQIIDK
jgi:hypothetical protein